MVTTPDVEVFNALASYAFANELELKAINHQNSGLATTYSITSGFTGTECHGKNKFLLGLNSYRLIANKHLPNDYLINSRKVRLELLAGIIDTDGCLNSGGYEIMFKSEYLLDQVIWLARSLGFAAYKREKKVSAFNVHEGTYYRANISGDVDQIPVKVERKKAPARQINKDVLNVGIKILPIGKGIIMASLWTAITCICLVTSRLTGHHFGEAVADAK